MIKDKFKNIPDTEFVRIEGIPENYSIGYVINKKGEVKGLKFKKILSTDSFDSNSYPFVTLYSSDVSEPSLHCYVHRLVALTFIVNDDPENKIEVDHIDRSTTNFNVNNLRWVTREENLKNSKKSSKFEQCFYQKLDDNGNVLESISFKDIPRKLKGVLAFHTRAKTKYKGYFWKRYDPYVEEYNTKYGQPLDSEWKQSPVSGIFCNKNGLIKYKTKRLNIFTIGTKNRDGYYSVNKNLVSRLVYSTFKENILGNPEIKIDHINTDRSDNRLINLRAVSSKGNANNMITIQKKKIPVVGFDVLGNKIREFCCAQEASDKTGISRSYINICCLSNSITELDDYVYWCYKGEEDSIPFKVNSKTIFEYNSNRELISGYTSMKKVREQYKPISDSILTKRACSINGNFYSIGPKDINNDSEWLSYKRISGDYNKPCISFDQLGNLSGEYNSLYEAENISGIPKKKILSCCEFNDICYRFNSKFTYWCYKEDNIDDILKNMIFKYDSNRNLLGIYNSIGEATRHTNTGYYRIGKDLNTGNQSSDDCYYYIGPMKN